MYRITVREEGRTWWSRLFGQIVCRQHIETVDLNRIAWAINAPKDQPLPTSPPPFRAKVN